VVYTVGWMTFSTLLAYCKQLMRRERRFHEVLILFPECESGGVHCGMNDIFFTAGILQAADEKRTPFQGMLSLFPAWDSGGVLCGVDDLLLTAGILQAPDGRRPCHGLLSLCPTWVSGGVHCGVDDLILTAAVLQAADEKRTLPKKKKKRKILPFHEMLIPFPA
jgi:hypothetical protein